LASCGALPALYQLAWGGRDDRLSAWLLYLAIARRFEPLLLVTIGFGGLLSQPARRGDRHR
jgi:Na+-transporting methylmalonyl-CoA/oxaloacetate decarboxylase beta subunit